MISNTWNSFPCTPFFQKITILANYHRCDIASNVNCTPGRWLKNTPPESIFSIHLNIRRLIEIILFLCCCRQHMLDISFLAILKFLNESLLPYRLYSYIYHALWSMGNQNSTWNLLDILIKADFIFAYYPFFWVNVILKCNIQHNNRLPFSLILFFLLHQGAAIIHVQ